MKQCEFRYKDCIKEYCNVICKGISHHPECSSIYRCKHDDVMCDGKCEAHKALAKMKELNKEFGQIASAINLLEKIKKQKAEEIAELREKIK